MKKKILSLALVAILALTAIIGGTLAYFTDNEKATNTFTLGNVNIELDESAWQTPKNVVPGVRYAKNPEVKNVGKNPAWIRMDVILSDAAEFKRVASKYSIITLDRIFETNADFNDKWELAGVTEDTTADTLTYSYYYRELLEPDVSTGALFNAVTIPAAFNNADMASIRDDFTITIKAHAIQDADGFDTVQKAFARYRFEAKTSDPQE